MAALVAALRPASIQGQVSVPTLMGNGDLSISYYGIAGRKYAQEWTDSLNPPVTWTPLQTNTADLAGLLVFTNTPASLQGFCRIHDVDPPGLVINLAAMAGNAEVTLSWTASYLATSYNVKRATTSGGPSYTTITNVTGNNFVNTGLTNETTYYFVVSALNANGENVDSSEASATPSTNARPLVYTVENTGANFPAPPLPTLGNLPFIPALPDPFAWASDPLNLGNTRSTNFADWSHRRAEIKAQIENYEIGYKPPVDPSMIFASYSGSATSGTLTVRVTNIVAGTARTLELNCAISIPAGAGPFPAIIGMNSPNGSIPSALITNRNIARITYLHNQVTTYGNPQNSNPYYALYAAPYSPALNIDNTGQYSAWAWGVSRIIDGLYKLNGTIGTAQINLQRIGVTGCSYAGKMALFCGALDERIALTIPQESGGGGAPNWRYSATEPSGTVEWIPNTDYNWFKNDMSQFGGTNVSFLPEDHHELMAMVAPRALFATGNPDGAVWLSNPSCYVSCRAVEVVYNTFGISDRFGYNINGGKSHCATTAELNADFGAFLDKFLLGSNTVNTTIRDFPGSYTNIDHVSWYLWWGNTNLGYTLTFEPECETVGTNWNISVDASASNGKFVTSRPGVPSSTLSAPTNSWDWVTIPFTLATNGNFAVFGRVNNPPPFAGDSFWLRMDSGPWAKRDGLSSSGWQWRSLTNYALAAGPHTLTIGYCETGAKLDKISISDYSFTPSGLGIPAQNICP